MATFKVGQRVKWVQPSGYYIREVPIGTTGTVMPPFELAMGDEVSVLCDVTPDGGGRRRYALPFQLAPLTDPGADAFLERMRKLKPYDEPKVEPVPLTVERGTPIWK